MKNYVIAISHYEENGINQYKISADNEFEALKLVMVEMFETEEGRESEIKYQESDDYPEDLEGFYDTYGDNYYIAVTEVKEF